MSAFSCRLASRRYLWLGLSTLLCACEVYDSHLLGFDATSPGIDAGGDAAAGRSAPVPPDSGGSQVGNDAADSSVRDASTGSPETGIAADAEADSEADADASDGASADGATSDAAEDAGVEAGADAGTDCGPEGIDCCPDDPSKTDPGVCGCNVPDEIDGCVGIKNALRNRYRFDGTGTVVVDAGQGQNGVVQGATLDGSGTLSLTDGTDGPYVDLPNGLVSALSNATFEAWITWNGGEIWQRIFDFGDTTDANEGEQGTGKTYLFLTADTGGAGGTIRAAYSIDGNANETVVNAAAPLESGVMHHLAVVIDDQSDQMLLYLDGQQQDSIGFDGSLGAINDVNNWLGRSQYSADSEFDGILHEFRIYDAALNATQMQASFDFGPDPSFLEP
jgi:hypothetical protein